MDDPGVCLSVCLSAEQINVLFGVDPRNIVLDEVPLPTPTVKERRFDAASARLLWPLVIILLPA